MPRNFNHTNEFSKRAKSYKEHNIIQKDVAKRLVSKITSKPKSILDLGCGSGAVYGEIDWKVDRFVGIDKASNMCLLHPKGQNIKIIEGDFEDIEIYKNLGKFDLTIASSSLQWAKDLNIVVDAISKISKNIAFAVFTDNTFKTIYEMSGLEKFLPSSDEVVNSVQRYYDIESETVKYNLHFKDNISKFRYIKNSGVSGGVRKLGYIETKKLIENYPLEYLEFEVVYIRSKN
jgi:malonyl-CoA O-methyltransferase